MSYVVNNKILACDELEYSLNILNQQWAAVQRFSMWEEQEFLRHNLKTSSGIHQGSYAVCNGGSFLESKVAGA